ncbi:MAG: arsenite methyltransferase [Chitinophagaceae bacterium]|nr:arsenite methyltransferase [Chitinophagaceae bacterium]
MTRTEQEQKDIVKETYTRIAQQSTDDNRASCCGAGGCSTEVYNIMTDDYSDVAGYNADADLGLGCGLPTQFAQIKPGNTVLDLGSGAGNDCFVARQAVGESGKVIGIDFTEAMIEKARNNADKLGYNNVEFRLGDIEEMPLAANRVDVIVSNCVLNLVPNKKAVFEEMFRVLKPGGHFSISDVVLEGELPDALRHDAEMYAGCVSGAIQKNDYLNLAKQAGFDNLLVQKQKPIIIPTDILSRYLSAEEMAQFNGEHQGIFSITLYAEKPATTACCTPGSSCCS